MVFCTKTVFFGFKKKRYSDTLNYCVGVKEKRPKKSYRNQGEDSEAEKL